MIKEIDYYTVEVTVVYKKEVDEANGYRSPDSKTVYEQQFQQMDVSELARFLNKDSNE